MIDLIQTSISLNNFSSARVHLLHRAVNDLPSNSTLSFSPRGGDTTTTNGSLHVSTIRLDDVLGPLESTVLLLKIDVEGFELNVLRSAEQLFRAKRIEHLIFEYTPWWTDRARQEDLLPYVRNYLGPEQLFALHRTGKYVYGPLNNEQLDGFYWNHFKRHLQTDIYATFSDSSEDSPIQAEQYDPVASLA